MAMANDRGYAVIATDAQGVVTVQVCTSIEHGRPVGVFAKHVQPPDVRIDPAVTLVKGAGHHRTAQVVEVSKGSGPVVIRPRRHSLDI